VQALVDENQKLRTLLSAQQIGGENQAVRLASLYVAVNSVHSATHPQAVLASVRDIVNTLVGSEEMALFEVDGERLRLVLCEGIDPGSYENARLGDGPIGTTATTGELFVRRDGDSLAGHGPIACIPLKLGERVVAVLAIFRLLPQKSRLDSSDLDLFDALTAHVARALVFTRLYTAGATGVSQ
jgi:GAF domain-containing protein